MRKEWILGLAVAGLVWVGGAAAQEPAGQLDISGTSTVRSWSCREAEIRTVLKAGAGYESSVVAGEKSVEAVSLSFPVEKIDCGNGKMEEHLEKALKAKEYPTISYVMSAYDIGAAIDAETVPVKVTGDMTIAGQTRPVTMDVTVTKSPDGGIRVQGKQEIRMTDFGVKPPTLMLGTLKVGDEVRVSFDMVMRAQTVALIQDGGSR